VSALVTVVALGGSLAQRSHTGALLRAAADRLRMSGAQVARWDLRERPLPLADPRSHAHPERHPAPEVRALVAAITEADALLLGSPVYHNSYAGVVKNALDHLAIPHFAHKPVGLLSNGGGAFSTQAVDHLRLVVRGLGGIAIPTQVVTVDEDYLLADGDLHIVAPAIHERLDRFVAELLWFCAQLRSRSAGGDDRRRGDCWIPRPS
jgi:azobenzene reductase